MSTPLYKLKLCGAVIDERVLSALDQVTPNLKLLTLSTCILNMKYAQNYYYDLPSSDLATLSIVTQTTFWDETYSTCDEFEPVAIDAKYRALWVIHRIIDAKKKQIASLLVSTLSSKRRFRVISEQDHLKYTAGQPSMVIECKSLKL